MFRHTFNILRDRSGTPGNTSIAFYKRIWSFFRAVPWPSSIAISGYEKAVDEVLQWMTEQGDTCTTKEALKTLQENPFLLLWESAETFEMQ